MPRDAEVFRTLPNCAKNALLFMGFSSLLLWSVTYFCDTFGLHTVHHPQISINHQPDQVVKPGFRLPAKLLPGLCGIADEEVDLGGALVAGIISFSVQNWKGR